MAKKTNCTINGVDYYRMRAKVGVDENGKNIIKAFYGKSKKEAKEKRDEYLQGNASGIIDYDKIVFTELYDQWLEVVKRPTIANSSFIRYERLYRRWIKPAEFSSATVVSIKPLDIQRHLNSIKLDKTANDVIVQLTMFFGYCMKEKIVLHDPMASIQRRKINEVKNKKKALTDADVAKLKSAFEKDFDLFLYVFALMTGLRRGEIAALTHKDIDFDQGVIHVYKSLGRVSSMDDEGNFTSGIQVTNTKNESSIRDVPIADSLIAPLKKHMRLEKEKHLRIGIPFRQDNFLFTSAICTAIREDRMNSRFKKAQKELGIEPVTFHGLRHTFCTMLAKNNVPLKTASVLMGHSNIGTTAKIYTHIDEQQKKSAVAALDSYSMQNLVVK
jgi:integrase